MGLDCVKYLFEKLHIRQATITQISSRILIFHSSYSQSSKLSGRRVDGGAHWVGRTQHRIMDLVCSQIWNLIIYISNCCL